MELILFLKQCFVSFWVSASVVPAHTYIHAHICTCICNLVVYTEAHHKFVSVRTCPCSFLFVVLLGDYVVMYAVQRCQVVVLDVCLGHRDFIRNMMSGMFRPSLRGRHANV